MKASPMERNNKLSCFESATQCRQWGLLIATAFAWTCLPVTAQGQVRTKRPDREVYQAPKLEPVALETVDQEIPSPSTSPLRRVSHDQVDLRSAPDDPALPLSIPQPVSDPFDDAHAGEPVSYQTHEVYPSEGEIIYEEGYADFGDGFASGGCDELACDSIGGVGGMSNGRVSLSRCDWFGSLELLLMFRRGDRPPTLVTTGPDEAGADAQVLVGGDSILKDSTAGGRLTLGTWLDDRQSRSLVMRGWIAGEETFDFDRDQSQLAVIGRPFSDVTDGQAPVDEVQIIASPGRANGSINIDASSNVFGGDVSVRQFWRGGYGGTIDLLYGYQYMRLSEDLRIGTSTISIDEDFAPLGSIIRTTDSFETENDFHGGQLGVAGQYREGSWSFRGLAKVGFGSLRRTATRRGSTQTSNDGLDAFDANGLLVRSTNSGKTTDHTFGWVPELDFTIGYQKFPSYELTLGYHVIAMSDALQTSGAIDPTLATDLSANPAGAQSPSQSPSPGLRYDTFYVQGIHFGIQYVY